MSPRKDVYDEAIWEYNDIHIFVSDDRRWAINRWSNVEYVEMPIALTHFCHRHCHYEDCWNYVYVPDARPWAMDPNHPPDPKDFWRCSLCKKLAPDDLIAVWRLLWEKSK